MPMCLRNFYPCWELLKVNVTVPQVTSYHLRCYLYGLLWNTLISTKWHSHQICYKLMTEKWRGFECDISVNILISLIQHADSVQFNSVQSLSHVWLFATPSLAAHQASLSITNSRSSLRPMSIESMMPFNHLILCRPLLLLPPIPPSIRVFSDESALHIRWPKYWSFSFSISPSNEHPGLISFRMDWMDFLAVQGTLKSLLQHHSSKASISDKYLQATFAINKQ